MICTTGNQPPRKTDDEPVIPDTGNQPPRKKS